MKTFKSVALLFAAASLLVLNSCDKDDDSVAKPEISGMEIGISDSHVGYIGADLHMEGEILALGTIDVVTAEIYQDDASVGIDSTYSDYQGLKNSTFHKHLDIPDDTEAGSYQIVITVYDQEGQYTTYTDDIEIEVLDDDEAPEITITTAPDSGATFSAGDSITIAGTITDNISLGGMFVALVNESDSLSDEDVDDESSQVIVMLHTHDFEDPDETEFSASIEVGAEYDNNMTPAVIDGDNAWRAGNYYILVKSKDANGNWAYSDHYPIVINY